MKRGFLIIGLIISFTINAQKDIDFMKDFYIAIIKSTDVEISKINKELSSFKPTTKNLISKNHTNGKLSIYRNDNEILKITKTFTLNQVQYSTDYYYKSEWLLYVEKNNITKRTMDKYYFDKNNLMVCLDSKGNYLTVSNKTVSENWFMIIDEIDKLRIISDMKENPINEDSINPIKKVTKTISKEDSLELKRIEREIIKKDSIEFSNFRKSLDSLKINK